MKKTLFVSILGIVFSLFGCLQVDTVVKVKSDGSGMVEETLLMKKDLLQQMKEMMEEMAKMMAQMMTEGENELETQHAPDSRINAEWVEVFNEKQLKERASKMGEDVIYVSGLKIVTDKLEGYKAIYAFKDINKLKINQNPKEKVPSELQQGGLNNEGRKEYITFSFIKGMPAELLIKLPLADKNDKPLEDHSGENPELPQNIDQQSEGKIAKMKELFEGMKMALAVEVEGKILETNANHREGSRIILMELDFGKLIKEMPEQFKNFSLSQPKTLEEAKQFMQGIPGIKADLNNEIRIKFE